MSKIIPTLRYRDASAAIHWLCEAFGCSALLVVPGENGMVAHAQLALGESIIMLGSATDDAFGRWQQPPVQGVGTQSPYVVVQDADAIHQRAVRAGAEMVVEIADQHGGGPRVYLS